MGKYLSQINITDTNPSWELFYQGDFYDEDYHPFLFSDLTACESDLYFGCHNSDVDYGFLGKLNTIGSPEVFYLPSSYIGKNYQSLVYHNMFIYNSSSYDYYDDSTYYRINPLTYERIIIFPGDDDHYPVNNNVLVSRGNYIYTSYDNQDIYRFNTTTEFQQTIQHNFEEDIRIRDMVFVGDDLYLIRDKKIGMLNF